MRLGVQDFIDKSIDPLGDFVPLTPDEETFKNGLMDPALYLSELDLDPQQLQRWVAHRAVNSILRQQQFLVYDMASTVGVLQPYVGVTQKALQAFDVIVDALAEDVIASQAILTSIGACGTVLSAVPTIYTQIAGAVISLGVQIAGLFTMGETELRLSLIPAQEYSKDTDADHFNMGIRKITQSGNDWTSIFSPRYQGDLTMQIRLDDADRMIWAWALGDGNVPKLKLKKSGGKTYAQWTTDGEFDPLGLGMIPGGERIYSVVQSTLLEPPATITNRHPTLYDPRCGSIRKVETIDVGMFYPTTAQAGMSLWDFLFQRGASCYTVNVHKLADQWGAYFNSIWNGVAQLWGNKSWQGEGSKGGKNGWGAGPWEESLINLVHNYTVGMNNEIGGFGAWTPNYCTSSLTQADLGAWSTSNAFYKIILPALSKLLTAQQWYLDNTTIAAYLPITGGVDADPDKGSNVMGAFKGNNTGTNNLRKTFVDARKRILNGSQKYEVRLPDVLDPVYRDQLEKAGGGTQGGVGSLVSQAAVAQLAWTPTGGPGKPPTQVYPSQRRLPWILAGASTLAAGAAAYYFADDLGRVSSGARRRSRDARRR